MSRHTRHGRLPSGWGWRRGSGVFGVGGVRSNAGWWILTMRPIPNGASSMTSDRSRALRRAAFVVVFLWFAVGGVAHFAATDSEMSIVPPYIPWPRAAVLASGVFELLGG